jgi:glycopeptide antibiotics resistance protein
MKKAANTALWVLFVLYLLLLFRMTVFRSSFGSYPLFSHGQILWVPFVSLWKIYQNSVSYFLYLFLGNLVWFVPFGLLLPILTKARAGTIFYCFLISLLIESLQYVFGTGVSEVEDLILNTLGGAIGYGIFKFLEKRCKR